MVCSIDLKKRLHFYASLAIVLTILAFFLWALVVERAMAVPIIFIESPASGATVSGSVRIQTSTTQGTERVEFYIDNVLKATTTTSSPDYLMNKFTYQWDTTSYANGSHTIRATAYDSANDSASATIAVSVSNAGGGGGGGSGSGSGNGGSAPSPAPAGAGSGEVFGRVVNTAWQTIPGTAVRVGNQVVPTNPGGEFRIQNVPVGIQTIYYDAPGYASQTQVVEVKAGQVTSPPACLLSPASGTSSGVGEIFGRVVDKAWKTVPGTCIRIDASIMPTNPGGEFRFTFVHPGIYTIYYDAPGYIGQTQVIEVKSGQASRPPTVVMTRGTSRVSSTTGSILGKVLSEKGQMIPGTLVRIDASLMPTNAAGEFRFTLVHPGIYTVYYDAPNYKGQTQVVEVKAGVETRTPAVMMSR